MYQTVDNFGAQMEESVSACDLALKPLNKKREKLMLFEMRKALVAQLANEVESKLKGRAVVLSTSVVIRYWYTSRNEYCILKKI